MKKIIIINALIWAALIIALAALFKGDSNYQYLFFGLLIAYSIIQALLADFAKKNKGRCSG